ncbi:MAG: hypothetical protein JNK82_26735 [Myxococcaceae bacterium]|nr:hypothetical protein [Myxococcaceae bacterium]
MLGRDGVRFGELELLFHFDVPGGIEVQLYELKYQKAAKRKPAPKRKPVAKKAAPKKAPAKKSRR